MAVAEQMSFLPVTPDMVHTELKETKAQLDNVRRGLFKRYSEINSDIDVLREEIASLKAALSEYEQGRWIRSKVSVSEATA